MRITDLRHKGVVWDLQGDVWTSVSPLSVKGEAYISTLCGYRVSFDISDLPYLRELVRLLELEQEIEEEEAGSTPSARTRQYNRRRK